MKLFSVYHLAIAGDETVTREILSKFKIFVPGTWDNRLIWNYKQFDLELQIVNSVQFHPIKRKSNIQRNALIQSGLNLFWQTYSSFNIVSLPPSLISTRIGQNKSYGEIY